MTANDAYEQGYLGIHQYHFWTRSMLKPWFYILFVFDSNIGRTGNWIDVVSVDRFICPSLRKGIRNDRFALKLNSCKGRHSRLCSDPLSLSLFKSD
jgi:hypothetical protein